MVCVSIRKNYTQSVLDKVLDLGIHAEAMRQP